MLNIYCLDKKVERVGMRMTRSAAAAAENSWGVNTMM